MLKKGAWISFEGNLVGQGREAAKQAIAENDALMKTITDAIMEKVEVTVGAVLAQNIVRMILSKAKSYQNRQ